MKNDFTSNLSTEIGNRIRELRHKKEFSQEKLAELADVHRTYIGQIERAEKSVSVYNVRKIAHALGVSLSEFFDTKNLK